MAPVVDATLALVVHQSDESDESTHRLIVAEHWWNLSASQRYSVRRQGGMEVGSTFSSLTQYRDNAVP